MFSLLRVRVCAEPDDSLTLIATLKIKLVASLAGKFHLASMCTDSCEAILVAAALDSQFKQLPSLPTEDQEATVGEEKQLVQADIELGLDELELLRSVSQRALSLKPHLSQFQHRRSSHHFSTVCAAVLATSNSMRNHRGQTCR